MSEGKSVDIRGLIDTYEFPCKLPGSGQELTIRPITTGQMKKILAYENETDPYIIEEALDKLITSCVVSDGFNVDNLYLQDRFFLLLEIRKVTKGNNYTFNFICPKCNVENIKSFSLLDLPNKENTVSNYIINIGTNLNLEVDFPTRGHQKMALAYTRKRKLKGVERDIEIVMSTFAACIRRVHTQDVVIEDVSFDDKMYILDNITSDKFDVFKDWFSDNNFGIDFEIEVGCTNCDFRDMMRIPLSDFFV